MTGLLVSPRLLNTVIPLTLTVLGSIIVLELGLRYFYQFIPLKVCAADPIVGYYACQPYLEYDKPIRLAYRYKPGHKSAGWWDPANPLLANASNNAAPRERNDAFWYEFEVDEMGFPNRQYEWQDQYDVVIAGDSFTIRTAPKSWIELLSEQTALSILTLGAPSWSTLNEVEAIKMHGLDKDPAWVIVMFFEGNDLFNTAQYAERQATGLSWKEFDLSTTPLYRKLITYHMLKYWGDSLLSTTDQANASRAYRYPVSANTEAGDIEMIFKDIHLLPLSSSYDTLASSDEFRLIKDSLLDLKHLIDQQDSQLLLVYIPSKEHIYWSRIWDPEDVNNVLARTVKVSLSDGDHGKLSWHQEYLSYEEFNANHNAQEELLGDFAREHDIHFLNLTPVFWEAGIQQGELYHYADAHWNQAGNQLAADVIAAYLQQNEDKMRTMK